ncbi:WhiB family transcriptional regulator [Actinomyces minihominis]|uniref:WhiB family transcriptional regulator n=1 Tax=Actinomyces minihominis TaxID=2002838 RepID=UPI000C07C349|nr:WhiB family transcriptional regulator [Actinomyces minihominis]
MSRSENLDDQHWVVKARCADDPPDSLFVRGAAQRIAKQRCVGCPVRLECLADALQCACDYGVWGGLTERERRAIRRRFPAVEDWMEWLETSDETVAAELRLSASPRVLALVRS